MLTVFGIILFILFVISALYFQNQTIQQTSSDFQQLNNISKALNQVDISAHQAMNALSSPFLNNKLPYQEIITSNRKLQSAIINFNLYISALSYGSESEEFKNNKGGLNYYIWKKNKIDKKIKILAPSQLIKDKAQKAENIFKEFMMHSQAAISVLRKMAHAKMIGEEIDTNKELKLAKNQYYEAQNNYNNLIISLNDLDIAFQNAMKSSLNISQYNRMLYVGILGVICMLIFVLLSFMYFHRYFMHPINKLKQLMIRIGDGDLEAEFPVKDTGGISSLFYALKIMTKNLKEVTVDKLYYEKILSTMNNMLLVTDEKLKITQANPELLKTINFKKEEILNKKLGDILIDKNLTSTNFLSKTDFLQQSEKQYRTKSGESIPVLFTSSILEKNGDFYGLVCVAQDLRELKKTQEMNEKIKEEYNRKYQRKLAIAERRAGMADLASSILHNIGNVLNSVNTGISIVHEKISRSKMNKLIKLDDLLKDKKNNAGAFFINDKQGGQIIEYISVLSDSWKIERTSIDEKLCAIKKSLDHIKKIISEQNNLAKCGGVTEKVDVAELLDEALLVYQSKINDHRINLEKHYIEMKNAVIDQVKVMQIVINLIKNSIESLIEAKKNDPTITLTIKELSETMFSIIIADNGIGIEEKNIKKLFTNHFTTKKKGHGFGLHASAIAAEELGGRLTASSEGFGKGAVFELTLPFSTDSELTKKTLSCDEDA